MPYHTGMKKKNMNIKEAMDKFEMMKNKPKPMNKPRTMLTKLQKQFMETHTEDKLHNQMMVKLMKKGYCIEQSHKLTTKVLGKHKN